MCPPTAAAAAAALISSSVITQPHTNNQGHINTVLRARYTVVLTGARYIVVPAEAVHTVVQGGTRYKVVLQ